MEASDQLCTLSTLCEVSAEQKIEQVPDLVYALQEEKNLLLFLGMKSV
jgi:hypothetical protein